jgi:hypothetical protein
MESFFFIYYIHIVVFGRGQSNIIKYTHILFFTRAALLYLESLLVYGKAIYVTNNGLYKPLSIYSS